MYKSVEPLIKNTEFEARVNEEGKIISYRIRPQKGYKLHEKTLDKMVVNEETLEETGEIKRGYTTSYITAGCKYDFELNPREIYATEV